VDAYWVGNDLLEAVDPEALVRRLEDRFRGQVGGTWRGAASRATAHHSFQVFEVYPWAELLRRGRPAGPAATVLDRCRIRVGRVLAVDGEEATVGSRLLAWDGDGLRESAPVTETVRWSVGGSSLIDAPEVGDAVALHWDWVCEVLSTEQARSITGLEQRRLRAVHLRPVS